jgi:hypothetical protein
MSSSGDFSGRERRKRMRMMKWNRGLWVLGTAAVGVLLIAGVTSAQTNREVTTNLSGSVVVYPKVIWDGSRDTIIQISNTGNPMVHAHCFYVNAAPADPFSPPSVTNPPQWIETDFNIWLTKQQPTHWAVSLGRRTDVTDAFGSDGSGLDPGLIPPVPFGFRGELKCIQVDDSGVPFRGNNLKGEATLRRVDGDVTKYNAVALLGNPDLGVQVGDAFDLTLNYSTNNPDGEYSSCPNVLIFDHFADGVPDPAVFNTLQGDCDNVCIGGPDNGDPCSIDTDCGFGGRCLQCPLLTTLTLVPCQENFEDQIPGRVTVQFQIFNEFEQPFSTSTTVDCWLDAPLSTIGAIGPANPFTYRVLGTVGAHTRITPNPGNGGVIGIGEETRFDTDAQAEFETIGPDTQAAFNLHVEGNRFDGAGVTDHIIVPEEF